MLAPFTTPSMNHERPGVEIVKPSGAARWLMKLAATAPAAPSKYEPEPALRWNVSVGLRRADDALVAAVDTAVARVVEQRIPAQIYAKYGIIYLPPSAEGLQ